MAHLNAPSLLLFATRNAFALRTVFPPCRLQRLHRSSLSRPRFQARVPASLLPPRSTGISTCLPSATPFGLALGPDFPGADQLYPGILGHPAWGIPTPISLLIPAFSLPGTPPLLSVRLLRAGDAPLPKRTKFSFPGFGVVFQPRTFSAQDPSASELLRTL